MLQLQGSFEAQGIVRPCVRLYVVFAQVLLVTRGGACVGRGGTHTRDCADRAISDVHFEALPPVVVFGLMQVSFGIRRGARHTDIADWLVCSADSDGGVVGQLTGRSSH